jgi:hypothetical protein
MLQRFVDSAAIAAEIARVRLLSGGALRRRWQAVFGRPPPEHLTADLLRRMIAARIQEEAFGTHYGERRGVVEPAGGHCLCDDREWRDDLWRRSGQSQHRGLLGPGTCIVVDV